MRYDGINYDAFPRHKISTQLKFCLWPRRCYISGKRLWLKKAYKETAMWTGPGDPVYESRWYDRYEFIMLTLKQ
jgi:hypothetical protein